MKSPPLCASDCQLTTTSWLAASTAELTSPAKLSVPFVINRVGDPWPSPCWTTMPPATERVSTGVEPERWAVTFAP
jgi:hypothetical protein